MLALDHIVIASNKAETESNTFNKNVTVKAVKGGEHENWGTYNYLAHFSNQCYIEWLGVRDLDIAKNSDNPLIKHLVYVLEQDQPGPFQFALRTTQMDDYVKHFNENNIPYQGPFPGQRQRPDGSMLKWRMLFPSYNYQEEMLPFLIEWGETQSNGSAKSLANPQAITKITYNSVDKSKFASIYQLKARKSFTKQFQLSNAKITFNPDTPFSFELL